MPTAAWYHSEPSITWFGPAVLDREKYENCPMNMPRWGFRKEAARCKVRDTSHAIVLQTVDHPHYGLLYPIPALLTWKLTGKPDGEEKRKRQSRLQTGSSAIPWKGEFSGLGIWMPSTADHRRCLLNLPLPVLSIKSGISTLSLNVKKNTSHTALANVIHPTGHPPT